MTSRIGGWRPSWPIRRLFLVGAILALLVTQLAHRRTVEWGNRLFRSGEAAGAADVYSAGIDTTSGGRLASYNLGTALLALESDDAERYLLRASEGSDDEVALRAHYNLGVRSLDGVNADTDPFAAVPLLANAIDHNRAVLRIDPSDENARWNLALAVRTFAEIAQIYEQGPAGPDGEAEGAQDESPEPGATASDPELADETRQAPPPEESGDPEGARIGAQETLARGDPGPLSEEAARRLLSELEDDRSLLVRGILWAERPQVEWWEDEPFPGGDR